MFFVLVSGILWHFEFWAVMLVCLQARVTVWVKVKVGDIVDIQTFGYDDRKDLWCSDNDTPLF